MDVDTKTNQDWAKDVDTKTPLRLLLISVVKDFLQEINPKFFCPQKFSQVANKMSCLQD